MRESGNASPGSGVTTGRVRLATQSEKGLMARLRPIGLNEEQQRELERLVASRAASERVVQRARVVLLAAQGLANREIAVAVGMHYNRVAVWRRRYAELGLAGLEDDVRSGRPPIYGRDEILQLLRIMRSGTHVASTRWTVNALAVGMAGRGIPISGSQVWRICSSLEIDDSFAGRGDPLAAPIPFDCAVGLTGFYHDGPARAVVVAVATPEVAARLGASPGASEALGALNLTGARSFLLDWRLRQNGRDPVQSGDAGLVSLVARLLGSLPDGVALSCTAEQLPPETVRELRLLDADRFHLHLTRRAGAWKSRVELLVALATRRVPLGGVAAASDGAVETDEPLAEEVMAIVRACERSRRRHVWSSRSREAFVAP
jgi:transposase